MTGAEFLAPEARTLATLVNLARRAREARDTAELAFIAVNETHALAPYRQAALWLNEGEVSALSGVVSPEANAPFMQWLGRMFKHLQTTQENHSAHLLSEGDLPASDMKECAEWLPPNILWLALPVVERHFTGGALLLSRDEPWTEAEIALLGEWAAIWSQARALLSRQSSLGEGWRQLSRLSLSTSNQSEGWRTRLHGLLRSRLFWAVTVPLGLLLIPVHLTVLAPAELVPLNPAVIRAPLDGVVDRVLVIPNQTVKADDDLFEFDRANIQNQLQVALRTLETVQAEYRQKAQQALFDPTSTSQLAVLQGQLVEKGMDVTYLRTLNERGMVTSPRAGVVLFDNPAEWVGRPVVTGERVMVVADEHAVEIEAWLSPADAIPLKDGARVTLYLNADPMHSVPAALRYIGHEAIERPDGTYAYRVRASLAEDAERPRVGLKGTAKLEGSQVSLAYWIVRRPLAAVRSWLGM